MTCLRGRTTLKVLAGGLSRSLLATKCSSSGIYVRVSRWLRLSEYSNKCIVPTSGRFGFSELILLRHGPHVMCAQRQDTLPVMVIANVFLVRLASLLCCGMICWSASSVNLGSTRRTTRWPCVWVRLQFPGPATPAMECLIRPGTWTCDVSHMWLFAGPSGIPTLRVAHSRHLPLPNCNW